MEHKHDYVAVYHPNPSAPAKEIGIRAIEMRKCKSCQKVMPFVMIHHGWVPLFEDTESGDQGILLA
jgi:hypothetical protein